MNFLQKIKIFLNTYKWLLLLLIPIGFFIYLLLFFVYQPEEIQEIPVPSPMITIVPTDQQLAPTISDNQVSETENEWEQNPEDNFEFYKKEVNTNGTITYYYDSGNPNRPAISITKSDGEPIFSRAVSNEEEKIASVNLFKEIYGEPERIIQGSKFYGAKANIYFYGSLGFAFISDPDIDYSFEKQYFGQMSIDGYLQRFGDQN